MANTQNLDLVKPLGTDHALVSVLNSNSDKIDAYAGAVNAGLDGLRDGLGILANGNTHAAITSGQFVYVKNHQTLPEGLYKASTNIAANGTLSTSNLTADSSGGLNALNEQIGTLLTRKKYTVSASPNQYVSPFSYLGGIDLTSDTAQYGKIVSVMVYKGGATFPASISPSNQNLVTFSSGQDGDHILWVVFSKFMPEVE